MCACTSRTNSIYSELQTKPDLLQHLFGDKDESSNHGDTVSIPVDEHYVNNPMKKITILVSTRFMNGSIYLSSMEMRYIQQQGQHQPYEARPSNNQTRILGHCND